MTCMICSSDCTTPAICESYVVGEYALGGLLTFGPVL